MTIEAMTKPQPDETALAHPGEGALGIEGLEGMHHNDLILPRLQIVQPTSAALTEKGAKPGTFYSNLTGETFEQLRIVPITITKGRVLFREGDERPTCKSRDGFKPSVDQPISDTCAVVRNGRLVEVCPSAIWNNGTPECRLNYNLLALNLEDEAPFFVAAKGMSVKPVKQLISAMALRRLSPFSLMVTLQLAKVKNAKGTFYTLEFVDQEVVEPRDKYREQFLTLRSYDTQKTYDAEESIDEGFGDDDAPEGDGPMF